MIEIIFNDSACGSLKQAQHLGKSKYRGECIDVFINHSDRTRPTREEIEEAKRQAQEKARLSWESVTPMGLDATDIYGLHMALSIGDISDRQFELNRRQVLEHLFSIYPNDEGASAANDIMYRFTCYLATIQKRAENGEAKGKCH